MKYFSVLLSLLLSVSAHAGIGAVTEHSGTAIIKRGGQVITVAKGSEVEQNDKVETKNGKVKITFKDDTTVSVTESSTLVIDDFVYDPKNARGGKLSLKAAAGTVRYVSGNIAHNNPNAVNIKTPTAAIAVRGTDFVMSVNEIGSSMIILMPSCEVDNFVNVKGFVCGSGKIDVETAAGIVNMNRPFQATYVEKSTTPPSPPVIVNLGVSHISNFGLQIGSVKTATGVNIVQEARSAAEKTGDAKKDDTKKDDDSKDTEKQSVVAKSDTSQSDKRNQAETKIIVNEDAVSNQVAAVSATDNPYLKKLWKDKSETQQVAWLYESLSQNGNNYANIIVPLSTQAQIIVTQDMVTNSYNFGSGGKAVGQIVINQSYR